MHRAGEFDWTLGQCNWTLEPGPELCALPDKAGRTRSAVRRQRLLKKAPCTGGAKFESDWVGSKVLLFSNGAEKSLQYFPEAFGIDGFLQVKHSQCLRSMEVRIGRVAALEDDGELGIPGQHLFGQLESVHVWQMQVKHEARAGTTALRGKELSGRFKSQGFEAEGLHESARRVSEGRIIINYGDHQNLWGFVSPNHSLR